MIHVSRSGATLGVYDEARVREGLKTGEFIGTDLGWREGMANWRPLSELESFGVAPAAAAPPVTPAASTAPSASADPQPFTPVTTTGTATSGDAATGLPWETRRGAGFFSALFDTIVMVLTRPAEAFGVMRREGNFADPLLFTVLMATVGGLVSFIYSLIFSSFGFMSGSREGLMSMAGAGVTSVVGLILAPIMAVFVAFVGAGIIHLCLMLVSGANRSFETTLRVFCYASGSANVLQVIPICGGLIAGLASLVLNVIGLARAHQTDTWRALVAILLPVVVCCGGVVLIWAAVMGGIASMAR